MKLMTQKRGGKGGATEERSEFAARACWLDVLKVQTAMGFEEPRWVGGAREEAWSTREEFKDPLFCGSTGRASEQVE